MKYFVRKNSKQFHIRKMNENLTQELYLVVGSWVKYGMSAMKKNNWFKSFLFNIKILSTQEKLKKALI